MKPITTHQFTPELLTSKDYFWNCQTTAELDLFNRSPRTDQFEPLLSIVQHYQKLYTLIATTVPTVGGWCSTKKACVLASLVLARKLENVIELGVFYGRSLLPMAFAMQALGRGIITGIDPYSSQASAEGQLGDNQKWWSEQDHKAVRNKFLEFVKLFKVEKHVRLIEQRSAEVNTDGWKVQLLHIDGNHGETAFHDAAKYGPLVELGGIVVCDDCSWEGGAVLRAIDLLEGMGFSEVIRRTENGENWNLMQRIKQ